MSSAGLQTVTVTSRSSDAQMRARRRLHCPVFRSSLIPFGLLLIFNHQISSAAAPAPPAAPPAPPAPADGSNKCLSEADFSERTSRFQRTYLDKLNLPDRKKQPDTRTCTEVARDMQGGPNNRSTSPWRYRIDHDPDRFPKDIAFAECLCQGCITNQSENLDLNSVPVFSKMLVLRRKKCSGQPQKYLLQKESIGVPVGCTCVVPRYT